MHKFTLTLLSLYTGLFLYAVSTAFVVPCITTLVSRYGEHHQKGIIIGIFRYTGICGICHILIYACMTGSCGRYSIVKC